jgi:hypothetical protein
MRMVVLGGTRVGNDGMDPGFGFTSGVASAPTTRLARAYPDQATTTFPTREPPFFTKKALATKDPSPLLSTRKANK